MAWGEAKAWMRGGVHQKLYQSLLENAIAAPSRNSKRRKVLHPEDMPWDLVLTAELVEKYLKRKIKEPA
jgi:hypothetical protein